MSKVFVISDTHFPFHNKKAFNKVISIIAKEKPSHVVQIGDLMDQYTFSRYSRSQSISPEKEIKAAVKCAEDMWRLIKKASSGVKCYQLLGNHDSRIKKRIMEKLPELEEFFSLKGLYSFKGVHTLRSERDFVKIDGVVYCHGWFSKSLDHAKYFNHPTVHGHRHRPEIATQGRLWSMDVGFLGDEKKLPFGYTMNKITNWTLGCGIVENGKPRLILL